MYLLHTTYSNTDTKIIIANDSKLTDITLGFNFLNRYDCHKLGVVILQKC